MSWTPKPKISSEVGRGRLLTFDDSQVLVGALEEEILIYQEAVSLWVTGVLKIATDWNVRAKVSTEYERGRMLTPDRNQILLGSTESDVLLFQEQSSDWIKRTKTIS